MAFWRSETEVRRRILENRSEYFWRDFLTGSMVFWRFETEVRRRILERLLDGVHGVLKVRDRG